MGSSSKQSTSQQQTQKTTPTFESPEARQMLSSLTKSYDASQNGALGSAQSDSAGYLKSLMGTSNPHTDAVISAMEAQAPREYAKNLSQVRTAGYRGGAGSDYINQAGLASDFANQLSLNLANTKLGQFNTDRAASLEAAKSLGSLGIANQSLGLSLLDVLKGTSSDTEGSSKSKGYTIDGGKVAAGVGTAILAIV